MPRANLDVITKTTSKKATRAEKQFEAVKNSISNNNEGDINMDLTQFGNTIGEVVSQQINENNIKLASELKLFLQDGLENGALARLDNAVNTKAEKIVRNFVEENYGVIERKCNLYINNELVKKDSNIIYHEKLEEAMNKLRVAPIYLCGSAGTGKTELAKQIAELMGLEFYYQSCLLDKYELISYSDVNGNYVPSQFYKCWTQGGIFCLDEADASVPQAIVALNGALSNKVFNFPAPIGTLPMHPDFHAIFIGNTDGSGSNSIYTGRDIQDGASMNRFLKIWVDYSVNIEKSLVGNDDELINIVHKIRKIIKKQNINGLISYRNLKYYNDCKPFLDRKQLMAETILKDMPKGNLDDIIDGLYDYENEYVQDVKDAVEYLKEVM